MFGFLLRAVPLCVVGLCSAGFLFQKLGARKDQQRFPPTGRLIETKAGLFHVNIGAELPGPTVVLESGLAGSSLSWTYVQEAMAHIAPVYSYDRAGFGWSGPTRSPRTLTALVEELRQLLEQIPGRPPYILVGHSFGGLIARAFSHRYPKLVAGTVLVDPVSTEHWSDCAHSDAQRLQRGVRLARRGELLARLGVVRLVLDLVIAGRRILPMTIARFSAPGASNFLQRLGREIQKLPPRLWPVVRAQWSRPMGFRAISSYLEALQQNCAEAESMLQGITVPTVILSASTATEAELGERERWLSASPAGQHVRVPDCGHWIQVEAPGAVVKGIQLLTSKLPNELPPPNLPSRV